MLRLFANANYDFIAFRRWAYAVTALFIMPGLSGCWCTGSTTASSSPAARWSRCRARGRPTSARSAPASTARASTAPRSRASAAPTNSSSAPGSPSRAPTPTTPRPPPTRWPGAHRRARRRELHDHAHRGGGAQGRRRAPAARRSSPSSSRSSRCWPTWPYRFEWRFGLAAVIATAHDILATIAFIAMLRLEVSLTVVAAVLSMVGYSLNDTIIIFDRVRENLKKYKKDSVRADPQPLDQRDPAAERADPRHHALVAARAHDLRWRGHPAVRAGHVLRRLHRHVLVDLHRLAGPDGDREAVARPARPRAHAPSPAAAPAPVGGRKTAPVGRRAARGRARSRVTASGGLGSCPRTLRRPPSRHLLPCSSTPTATSPTRRTTPTAPQVLARAWAAGLARDRRHRRISREPPSARCARRGRAAAVGDRRHPSPRRDRLVRRGPRLAARARLRRPEVVAAGEMGLDYHYDYSPARRAATRCSRPSSTSRARRASRSSSTRARRMRTWRRCSGAIRDVPAILHSFSSGPGPLAGGARPRPLCVVQRDGDLQELASGPGDPGHAARPAAGRDGR